MNTLKKTIAATELVFILPAVLFMTALFVRNLQPLRSQPAHTAQQIVLWYAARPRIGLWVFLIALPLAVFVGGCVALLRSWRDDVHLREGVRKTWLVLRSCWPTVLIAVATVTSACVLAIVALHVVAE